MSMESAKEYMRRMRDDPEFKRTVSGRASDDDAWAFIRSLGYDFTVAEFKQVQEEVRQELGFLIGKE